MYDQLKKELSHIEGWVYTRSNDMAWPTEAIPRVLEFVFNHQWIVLGGDVVTLDGKYTYDNWCYNPVRQYPLEVNVCRSIAVCSEYISNYIQENGNAFFFTLSISNTYVGVKY